MRSLLYFMDRTDQTLGWSQHIPTSQRFYQRKTCLSQCSPSPGVCEGLPFILCSAFFYRKNSRIDVKRFNSPQFNTVHGEMQGCCSIKVYMLIWICACKQAIHQTFTYPLVRCGTIHFCVGCPSFEPQISEHSLARTSVYYYADSRQ